MKVRIASIGDLRPTKNPNLYFASLIVLVEGQSELMSINVMLNQEHIPKLSEGAVIDVVPAPDARFSVKRYDLADGKSSDIVSAIDKILKGSK